jgi:hypothetical protein
MRFLTAVLAAALVVAVCPVSSWGQEAPLYGLLFSGGGFNPRIVVENPTSETRSVRVVFVTSAGQSWYWPNGQEGPDRRLQVDPGKKVVLDYGPNYGPLQEGRILLFENYMIFSIPPKVLGRVEYNLPEYPKTKFWVPFVQSSADIDMSANWKDGRNVSFSVVNTDLYEPTWVSLQAANRYGEIVAETKMWLPAGGQRTGLASGFFPELARGFKGTLQISSLERTDSRNQSLERAKLAILAVDFNF